MRELYFDNNATTKTLPQVRQAMLEVLSEDFGNPSSAHYAGERVRHRISRSREAVAALIGADPEAVYFTSGGTESNNAILHSALFGASKPRIITTTIEHSSILKHCERLEETGVEVIRIAVDRRGLVSEHDVELALAAGASLVSIQWVNNETGVIQPIEGIAGLCKERGVLFHTDAAQAVGKLSLEVGRLPVDFLSMTGHKFHGPQGIGAIYARDRKSLQPMFFGGSQEDGFRPGTENVSGIVGMGKAAEIRLKKLSEVDSKLSEVRDRFEHRIFDRVPGVAINGCLENRVCNTSNLLFHGIDGQALIAQLDRLNIRCSQSSACTNSRPEPSYVLRAMGLSESEAYASVRFSFSGENTVEEVDWAAQRVGEICCELRALQGRHARNSVLRG